MDIKSLRYFVAVAEEENFRRASERLHIAQSALSRQIAILQQAVGVKLFDHAHGRVRLSEAGQAYLKDVKRILGSLAEAADHSRRIGRGEIGILRVSATEQSLTLSHVKNLLQDFILRYPKIQLRLFTASSPNQFELLRRHEIDAGFVYQRPITLEPFVPIMKLDIQVALPMTHKLARSKSIRFAQLENEPLIMRPSANSGFAQRLNAAFLSNRFSPKVACEIQHTDLALELVRSGIGLLILPRSPNEPPVKGMVFRDVTDLSIPMVLDLIFDQSSQSTALDLFVDFAASFGQAGRNKSVTKQVRSRTQTKLSGRGL